MIEFFDNIRFELSSDGVNVTPLFKCKLCNSWKYKKDISNYNIPVSAGRVAEYHKATFMCRKCQTKSVEDTADSNISCDKNTCKNCKFGNVLKMKDELNSGPFGPDILIHKVRCNISNCTHDLDYRCTNFEADMSKVLNSDTE